MDLSAMFLGVLAGLAVVVTWYLPKVIAAGRIPHETAPARPPAQSIRTVRDFLDARYAEIVARARDAGTLAGTCAYCGDTGALADSRLVPASIEVNERCASCATLRSPQNTVLACAACRSAKGEAGLYDFYAARHPGGARPFERIPAQVERKYLATVRDCLACADSLDAAPARNGIHAVDAALRPFLH